MGQERREASVALGINILFQGLMQCFFGCKDVGETIGGELNPEPQVGFHKKGKIGIM